MSSNDRAFFVASWLLAAPVAATLAIAGFRRTTSLLHKLPTTSRGRAEDIRVDHAEQLVRRAFRWSPARWSVRRGGCLPQSIVQYAVHTLRGQPVRLVVGVPPSTRGLAPEAFEAHAWVEDVDRRRPDVRHVVLFEMTPPR